MSLNKYKPFEAYQGVMESKGNDKIFAVKEAEFEGLTLEVFHFQYANNPVYRAYVDTLQVDPKDVVSLARIPFLPISFFKTHEVMSTVFRPDVIFESSGTTGAATSRHFVRDADLYKRSFIRGLEIMYGPITDWCIIGLLPSYLEREHSSLVYMVNELMQVSQHPANGFYLQDFEKLAHVLTDLEKHQQKTILFGVTFGLLDFAAAYPMQLEHTIIMETGGMKGRRKELVRQEVHETLRKAFSVPVIHSEYGMTELLSQAYSKGHGLFETVPWCKIVIRDEEDPLSQLVPKNGNPVSGVINIIDLANIYSCSFIATDDAGRLHPDGRFEVLGRLDNSDLRGCSLLVTSEP